MKTRKATSLRILEQGVLAVRIATADGATPYRVVWSALTAEGHRATPDLQRAFGGSSGVVTQIVPNGDVSYSILPLPPLKAHQQEMALRGLLAREQGGVPGEWLLDATALQSEGRGPRNTRQDFCTAFARDAVVRRHLHRAHALGARPEVLTAGYLALDALYRRHRPDPSDEEAWNLVCLDPQSCFLCVGDGKGLLFQRDLPRDLSEGAELPEYLERLTTEIERSNFFAQQAERSLRVGRVVVCGEPELADRLVASLSASLAVPAERWRLEDLFAWPDAEVRSDLALSLAGAVIGLESRRPNLLPSEFRRDRGRSVRRGLRKVSTAGAAIAVPLLLAGGLWTAKVQRDSLAALRAREDELNTRAQETALDYLRNRVLHEREANLRLYRPDHTDLAALLADIAERTPETVIYRDLSLEREPAGGYRLRVHGESLGRDGQAAQEDFLVFLQAMRGCDRLLEIHEESHLEIAAADDEQDASSRVIFILEYRVTEGRS